MYSAAQAATSSPTSIKLLEPPETGAQSRPDLSFALATPSAIRYVAAVTAATNAPYPTAGTEQRPWATIEYAASQLQPGEAAFIKSGVYREIDINSSRAGSSTAPIWLMSAPSETVVIANPTGTPLTGPFLRMKHPYWIVDGLTFDASGSITSVPTTTGALPLPRTTSLIPYVFPLPGTRCSTPYDEILSR
ncbi:MAG TPA: chondroitinase-B domain-containing protein [Chloroflexia bacterium]